MRPRLAHLVNRRRRLYLLVSVRALLRALTGGHGAGQMAATPAEPYAVRLLAPATGLEIKTKKNDDGEYVMDEPDKDQMALIEEKEKAQGIEGTINIGYARACRHYTDKAKDLCFSQFNPP